MRRQRSQEEVDNALKVVRASHSGSLRPCKHRPGEKISAVVDRLKNWTKEGLLQPVEESPGTGVHRQFSEGALVDAAVLSVLTDQIGMPAVRARAFAKLFKHSRSAFKRTDFKRFVVIARSPDNRAAEIGFARAEGLADLLVGSPHEAHIVIDLQQLFKRLERPASDPFA